MSRFIPTRTWSVVEFKTDHGDVVEVAFSRQNSRIFNLIVNGEHALLSQQDAKVLRKALKEFKK